VSGAAASTIRPLRNREVYCGVWPKSRNPIWRKAVGPVSCSDFFGRLEGRAAPAMPRRHHRQFKPRCPRAD
jgi:hypothetical protein